MTDRYGNRCLARLEFQRAMSPQTLGRLRENGSDLSRPHRLFNVFHGHRHPQVESLCQDFEAAGFLIHESGTVLVWEGTLYSKVEGWVEAVPALAVVNTMTGRCAEVAGRHHADDDGLCAEVVTIGSESGQETRIDPPEIL